MPRLPNLLYVLFLIPRCLSSSVFQNTKALMVLLLLVLCFSESILATMMPCCNWKFLKRFELLAIWIWGHKPISNSQNQIQKPVDFRFRSQNCGFLRICTSMLGVMSVISIASQVFWLRQSRMAVRGRVKPKEETRFLIYFWNVDLLPLFDTFAEQWEQNYECG